jgi:hypothetical protein
MVGQATDRHVLAGTGLEWYNIMLPDKKVDCGLNINAMLILKIALRISLIYMQIWQAVLSN